MSRKPSRNRRRRAMQEERSPVGRAFRELREFTARLRRGEPVLVDPELDALADEVLRRLRENPPPPQSPEEWVESMARNLLDNDDA